MAIYLDTNVFYNAYCPVEEPTVADQVLESLTQESLGITCEWSVVEMFRAFKKQVNLGVIAEADAQTAIDFFLADLAEMTDSGALRLIPVTLKIIMNARKQIFERNLYSADVVHATVANEMGVKAFITYDRDFRMNLGEIPVLNPVNPNFLEELAKTR